MKTLATGFLLLIVLMGLAAPWIAPYEYERQFRDLPAAGPQPGHFMGTDDVGRDRFSRLVYATRISVVFAPTAALVSIMVALLISSLAAWPARLLTSIFLSLPWIFLFMILRSKLPLNTSPEVLLVLTFGLMGIAGWAFPSRIFSAAIREMGKSGWLLQARAAGLSPVRIAMAHAGPHLWSLVLAQFRVLIPAYVLSEASLGLLGLGVPDPLPSWGNLLRELQHPYAVQANPWLLAPLALLIAVMISLEVLDPSRRVAI
ncbi:MAG: binding-protein-dependent transport system inner rane component [Bryobacterales bacterium]|nr:binding-protein-dependent transport system inner rane component [Bryobacterales bacterium]